MITIATVATILGYTLLGMVIGIVYRFFLKKIATTTPRVSSVKNIGRSDRLLRAGIGIVCLVAGITLSSAPLMIAAGFCFYEAAAKWCGFYALIGRNTCPLP